MTPDSLPKNLVIRKHKEVDIAKLLKDGKARKEVHRHAGILSVAH
jgi:hypothetical protein